MVKHFTASIFVFWRVWLWFKWLLKENAPKRASVASVQYSGRPTAVEIVQALLWTTRFATQRSAPVPMRISALSSASRGATSTTTTSSTHGYPMSTRTVSREPSPHCTIRLMSDFGETWPIWGLIIYVFICLFLSAQKPESVSWAANQRRRERWSSWTRWCTMGPAAATQTLSAYAHVETVWYVFFHFPGQAKHDHMYF